MKARSSVQAKATPKAKAKPSGEGKEGTALPVALGGLSRAMHSSASRVLDSIVKVIDGMTARILNAGHSNSGTALNCSAPAGAGVYAFFTNSVPFGLEEEHKVPSGSPLHLRRSC